MQKALGVALDIGTTTIQGKLIDLKDKRELSYFSCLNEQLIFGHDIISRIKFSCEKPNGLEKLNKKIISSINFVIESLLSIAKEDKTNISSITCVGNTALYYFTFFLSPERLVEPPYEPEYKGLVKKKAKTLGIEANSNCEFIFLPNMGGFVGSDAIGVILATDLDKSEMPILAVDIGTNGEIILGFREKIWVASTAAGPAFEGWHISCGMRAVSGAVESVEEREEGLDLKVIGGVEPKGLSGSALIDTIGILLKKKHIDTSGKMRGNFILYDKNRKISVSQDDVRQVQLAKAAFSSGIKLLRGLSDKEIKRFFITGKFGKYLNKENAKRIGIIPKDIELDRVETLENGALKGAEIFLNNRDSTMPRIEEILAKTEHISLGQYKNFEKEYVGAMRFDLS